MKDVPRCRYCEEGFSNEYHRNVHEAEHCSARPTDKNQKPEDTDER